MKREDKILLSHGSGGRLTHDLIRELFARHFSNEYLAPLSDSALLNLESREIAFTTDSYVVNPLRFPGGDIGKLAICGTINDLAVAGGKPEFISCGFIIEEGLEFGELEDIVISMAETAKEAGVKIVTGDTKVVESGSADRLFINTAGIGTKIGGIRLGCDRIAPGDKIIINGTIGDHGMAVMAARGGLGLQTPLTSDCAPLYDLIRQITGDIKFMRDPTRGGLATTLCEIAESCGHDIEIDETLIPISDAVKGIAEILGIDPLFSANEGKVVIVTSETSAPHILGTMRNHPLGKGAEIIGAVKNTRSGRVTLKTEIGTHRQITMMSGMELPRIC